MMTQQERTHTPRNLLMLLSTLLLITLFITSTVFAEPKKKRLRITKGKSFISSSVGLSEFSLSDSLNDILRDSADTGLYDPLTLIQLRDLKERAEPWWEDNESVDPEESRAVAQKAIAIQTSTNLISLLRKSEVRWLYKDLARGFKEFSEYFRYSLQDTGEGYAFSREEKGQNLMELNLKFSVNRGADPQIYLGESVRLRYDWTEQHTMIEYGFNF